ncbi:hypothetical protein MMC07_004879 [Pseudocyphellaria aurata]|nr:hypothetical protein [Pseudocyphellaria aurata]
MWCCLACVVWRERQQLPLLGPRPTTNARGKIRRRQAPLNTIAPSRDIPISYEEADEADKLLLDMRDSGTPWKIIRAAWTEKNRQETGGSTLPNRYKRIKIQMMRLKEGDAEHLLAAAAEVEAEFKASKFALMAAKIEAAGGETYSPMFLQKQLIWSIHYDAPTEIPRRGERRKYLTMYREKSKTSPRNDLGRTSNTSQRSKQPWSSG